MQRDLRRLARKLGKSINAEMMRLGEVLAAIHGGQFFHDWGYKTWADYVESEVGIGVATSYDLLSITRWVRARRLTKAQRTRFMGLGRCKMAALSRMAEGADIEAWLGAAERETVSRLRGLVNGEFWHETRRAARCWMTEAERRSVERALRIARDKQGDDLIRGELLSHIREVYYQQERKGTRKRKRAA